MSGSRINSTLFDKLVADLELEGLRDDRDRATEVGQSLRFYKVPRIERFNETSLRATVLRELNWLLNTTNLAALQDMEEAPEVVTSVLNYGLNDLSGKLLHRRGIEMRGREIRDAVLRFEPRIDPASLDVEQDMNSYRPNTVTFTIRGDISNAVNAMPVEFRTDIEIDTGSTTLWAE